MYKVVSENLVPVKEDLGKGLVEKHLLVQQTKGRMRPIPVFKKEITEIASGLSFQEAKEIRSKNKNSKIVRM
jgi:hypothetical protein